MDQSIERIGNCLACRYDLRGLESPVCPECGRAFDPADASTLGPVGDSRPGPGRRWGRAAAGWTLWVATAALMLAILGCARFPAEIRGSITSYRYLWPALLTLWGGRLLVQCCLKWGIPSQLARRNIRLAPAIFMLCQIGILAILVRREIIFHAAMAWSTPALNRLADPAQAQGAGWFPDNPRWVGVYRVRGGQVGYGGLQLWSAEVHATFFRRDGGPWQCNPGQRWWCL